MNGTRCLTTSTGRVQAIRWILGMDTGATGVPDLNDPSPRLNTHEILWWKNCLADGCNLRKGCHKLKAQYTGEPPTSYYYSWMLIPPSMVIPGLWPIPFCDVDPHLLMIPIPIIHVPPLLLIKSPFFHHFCWFLMLISSETGLDLLGNPCHSVTRSPNRSHDVISLYILYVILYDDYFSVYMYVHLSWWSQE